MHLTQQKRELYLVTFEAVVFDLDGTLINIDQRELHSINKALSTAGKPVLSSQSFIEEYYSCPYERLGARSLLSRAIGNEALAQRAVEVYREEFWKTAHLNKLHEGALHVLKALRDRKLPLAIATLRARRALVEEEIKKFEINDFIDVLVTREDIENPIGLPPSIDVVVEARMQQLQKTLKLLKAEPSVALIVGDGWWDIRAAKQVQARTVWVRTGFGAYNDFSKENPDITIRSLNELLQYVNL